MSAIRISRYTIHTGKRREEGFSPVTMVMLADLHNACLGDGNRQLLEAIEKAEPAAVLSAGDLVVAKSGRVKTETALSLLEELVKRYPVYCANGNHESRIDAWCGEHPEVYEDYTAAAKTLGAVVLRNESAGLEIEGQRFRIYGYELPWEYYGHAPGKKLPSEELDMAFGRPDTDAFSILLAHHPSYFSAYAAWGADLTLSGHLHGGMIRLPVLGGVVSPGWSLFPKYDRGLFEQAKKDGTPARMIVSAGLGSHTIKLRINNPPELAVIDFM